MPENKPDREIAWKKVLLLQGKLADLQNRLKLGATRIKEAAQAGQDVSEWQSYWQQLENKYKATEQELAQLTATGETQLDPDPLTQGYLVGITSEVEEIRLKSIDELGRLGSQAAPYALTPLLSRLSQADPSTRTRIIRTLGNFGAEFATEIVEPVSKFYYAENRLETAVPEALLKLGNRGIEKLFQFLFHSNNQVREYTANLLARTKQNLSAYITEFLIDPLYNDNPQRCLQSLEVLEILAPEYITETVEAVIRITNHPETQVRVKAITVLGRMGRNAGYRVIPVLLKLLEDENPEVRWVSLWALDETSTRLEIKEVTQLRESQRQKDQNAELPALTRQLIETYLQKVRETPEHQLSGWERYTLYLSFGLSRLTLPGYKQAGQAFDHIDLERYLVREQRRLGRADYVLGWLAVITARKVSATWNETTPQVSEKSKAELEEMLEVAEGVLKGSLDIIEAKHRLLNDFWYFHRPELSYQAYCSLCAAIYALDLVIFGGRNLGYRVFDGRELEDFAQNALNAFTSGEESQREEAARKVQKEVEFWEWWLTEAIPQAWELAITPSTI